MKIKKATRKKSKHLVFLNGGWGTGYVGVDKCHPWYGKEYEDDIFKDVSVHGGLTYSGYSDEFGDESFDTSLWWVGFDTFHLGDDNRLDKKFVEKETENLYRQAVEAAYE